MSKEQQAQLEQALVSTVRKPRGSRLPFFTSRRRPFESNQSPPPTLWQTLLATGLNYVWGRQRGNSRAWIMTGLSQSGPSVLLCRISSFTAHLAARSGHVAHSGQWDTSDYRLRNSVKYFLCNQRRKKQNDLTQWPGSPIFTLSFLSLNAAMMPGAVAATW